MSGGGTTTSSGRRWGDAQIVVGMSVTFFAVAVALFAVTEHRDVAPVYGDEQHYLVMTKGLVEHQTLEQTEPYRSEFEDEEFFEWAFTGTGFENEQRHVVDGRHGVYSFHQPGLAFAVAIPYFVGGLVGVRLALIAMAVLLVPLTWAASGYMTDKRSLRVSAVVLVAFAFPFLMSSNQIYPEMAGGLTTLAFIVRQFERQRKCEAAEIRAEPAPGYTWIDLAAVSAVSIAPWFHFRFAFATVAMVLIALLAERRRRTPRYWLILCPMAVSGVVLMALSIYQYGRFSGPFEDSTLQYGRQAAVVFAGLYIDQFQGILVLMPVATLALVVIGRFVARFNSCAWMVLAAHLLMILPNAGQPDRYGGFGFPGRFGWSALIVAIPLVVFAVIRFAEWRPRLSIPILVTVFVVQVLQLVIWTFGDVVRYNTLDSFASNYPAQFPALRSITPILIDDTWAFRYLPNTVGVLAAASLIAVGLIGRPGALGRRAAVVAAVGGLVMATVGVVTTTPNTPIVSPLAIVPSETGRVGPDGSKVAVEGIDEAGNLSTGPYVELDPGRYSVAVEYVASADDLATVGVWSLALQPDAVEVVASGEIPVTAGLGRILIDIEVSAGAARQVDFSATWFGEGEIGLRRMVIVQLDGESEGS